MCDKILNMRQNAKKAKNKYRNGDRFKKRKGKVKKTRGGMMGRRREVGEEEL